MNINKALEFIEKSKKIHNDKYNYSKVEYINSKRKVIIICDEHGEFLQRPYNHSIGEGCPKCSIKTIKKKLSSSKEKFIKQAIRKHGCN
jgi:hypothetical protein